MNSQSFIELAFPKFQFFGQSLSIHFFLTLRFFLIFISFILFYSYHFYYFTYRSYQFITNNIIQLMCCISFFFLVQNRSAVHFLRVIRFIHFLRHKKQPAQAVAVGRTWGVCSCRIHIFQTPRSRELDHGCVRSSHSDNHRYVDHPMAGRPIYCPSNRRVGREVFLLCVRRS